MPMKDMAIVVGINKPKTKQGEPPKFPAREKYDDATDSYPGKPNGPAGKPASFRQEREAQEPPAVEQAEHNGSLRDRIFAEGQSLGLDSEKARYFARFILENALQELDGDEAEELGGGELPVA